MARPPENRISVDDFPGEVNNADKSDLPPGAAQTQINLTSRVQGELGIRRGFRIAINDSVTLVTSLTAD